MSVDTGLMTLSKTEFESIKAKLTDLPKEPLPRIMAIAQAISDSGIGQDRLDDAFHEVCRQMQ